MYHNGLEITCLFDYKSIVNNKMNLFSPLSLMDCTSHAITQLTNIPWQFSSKPFYPLHVFQPIPIKRIFESGTVMIWILSVAQRKKNRFFIRQIFFLNIVSQQICALNETIFVNGIFFRQSRKVRHQTQKYFYV